jgi:hypothetical protein
MTEVGCCSGGTLTIIVSKYCFTSPIDPRVFCSWVMKGASQSPTAPRHVLGLEPSNETDGGGPGQLRGQGNSV